MNHFVYNSLDSSLIFYTYLHCHLLLTNREELQNQVWRMKINNEYENYNCMSICSSLRDHCFSVVHHEHFANVTGLHKFCLKVHLYLASDGQLWPNWMSISIVVSTIVLVLLSSWMMLVTLLMRSIIVLLHFILLLEQVLLCVVGHDHLVSKARHAH